GQRVVARVAVEEVGVDEGVDLVRLPEAELLVEAGGGGQVGHDAHDVAETLFAGHEPRQGPPRLELAGLRELAVVQLVDGAARIGHPHQAPHGPLLALLVGALGHGVAGGGQLVGRLGQVVVAGQLPAEIGQAVLGAGVDGQAVVAVVHAQVDAPRPLAVDELHSEDGGAELLPLLRLGGLDTDVAQGPDLHRSASRKSMTSRSNSPACSTWAQWPQLGNTWRRASGMYLAMNRAESSGRTRSSRPQVMSVRLVIRCTSRHS